MIKTIADNKKAAALVVSFLALGVLGTASVAGAYFGGERINLSEEERTVLQEVHELIREGDIDEAREYIADSDLSDEIKERFEARLDRHEHRGVIKEALENDDYNAFVELTEDASFADQVDEDFFEALQEAHELRAEGDKEGAREVLEEAGIELPQKGHRGGHGPRGV